MNQPTLIDGEAGKIAIHDLGGDGPETLLVCHATGFLGMAYRAFARELHDVARVFAVDMRAHGDSDAPRDIAGFTWKGMADDLARSVAHINAESLHGFGHSMGATALLEVERTQPGTFATAMAFEPIVPPTRIPKGTPIQAAAAKRLRTFPSRGDALMRYSARPPLGLFRADVLHDYVQHGFVDTDTGQVTLKCLPEHEATVFSQAGTVPLASLAEIELDVVVARSGDGGLPAQLAEAVVETMPNGKMLDFSNLTHFGPLQDPVIVANAMRELVTSSS